MNRLALFFVTGILLASSPQLYAPDGTYLGNLNANPYDPNSVSNPYGKYGSPYSPYSIHDPYGKYGSPYSPDSANNPYATGGPRIVVPGGNGSMEIPSFGGK